MTTTTTTTLPITGRQIASADFTVKKIRSFRAIDGEGCEAEILWRGQPAGTIEDGGTGGGAWFRASTPEARAAFAEMVAATPAYDLNSARAFGPDPLMADGEEAVAEMLVQEALLAKKIAAHAKKGRLVFIDPTMDRTAEFATCDPADRERLPEGSLVWTGSAYEAAK